VVSFILEGRREVGYWLGREFWGKGIATSALQLFLEEISERPLFAFSAHSNPASARVLQKCGFSQIEKTDEGSVFCLE
jgi:RimJ/RimL family protein N-acetyltransferase